MAYQLVKLRGGKVLKVGAKVLGVKPEPDYLTFTAVEATDLALNKNGTFTNTPVLYYSKNKGPWTEYTFNDVITLAAGDGIRWKGDNERLSEYSNRYITFSSTGKVNASGTMMSLIDSTCESTEMPTYNFFAFFRNCATLLTAPNLPATETAVYCYYQMFKGCTNLTTPPEALPAMSVAADAYHEMFHSCSNLLYIPALPATTVNARCYKAMFFGCEKVTTATRLPAAALASECYFNMFRGCKNLKSVPALPANALTYECYTMMFRDCVSLQISDAQTADAPYAFTIPTTGAFTNTAAYDQVDMFASCLGTRASNKMTGATGESHTYYTQNPPIA